MRLTITTDRGDVLTAPIILGTQKDLINLPTPQKPISTDWAERPGLDVVDSLPLTPERERSFSVGLFLPNGEKLPRLNTLCTLSTEGKLTYSARIERYSAEEFPDGKIYTLRGTITEQPIQQPPQGAPIDATTDYTAMQFTLNDTTLAKIGAYPLEGWYTQLRTTIKIKRQHRINPARRDARDVTLPTLLQASSFERLMNAREQLISTLYKRTRNTLDTPWGNFDYTFTRAKVSRYDFFPTHFFIIYDLTLTLL